MRSTPPQITDADCPVCAGLLGALDPGEERHRFCAWARAEDWLALKPWLDGTLSGVQLGGG